MYTSTERGRNYNVLAREPNFIHQRCKDGLILRGRKNCVLGRVFCHLRYHIPHSHSLKLLAFESYFEYKIGRCVCKIIDGLINSFIYGLCCDSTLPTRHKYLTYQSLSCAATGRQHFGLLRLGRGIVLGTTSPQRRNC